jgi:hypothetical protein
MLFQPMIKLKVAQNQFKYSSMSLRKSTSLPVTKSNSHSIVEQPFKPAKMRLFVKVAKMADKISDLHSQIKFKDNTTPPMAISSEGRSEGPSEFMVTFNDLFFEKVIRNVKKLVNTYLNHLCR